MGSLLERGPALAVLREVLAEATTGCGRVVLVTGEPGVGKSSLLRVFAGGLPPELRVLRGACDDLLTARALGALRDAAAGTGGPLEVALADGGGNVFDAVLAELSASVPTVLLVEDVHWADDATLDVLGYVARRIARLGAVVVVTIRDGGAPAGHAVHRWLGMLAGGQVRMPTTWKCMTVYFGFAWGTGRAPSRGWRRWSTGPRIRRCCGCAPNRPTHGCWPGADPRTPASGSPKPGSGRCGNDR